MPVVAEDRVVIKNIYCMMAYAFRAVSLAEYRKLAVEEFDRVEDLLAAILALGIGTQRKRGLDKAYSEVGEDILGVRGRIDVQGTARLRLSQRHEIACVYDEYSEDTCMNRVLKCCSVLLLRSPDVAPERKAELKRCLMCLSGVSDIAAGQIKWGSLRFHRNNAGYRLLMNVCHMVVSRQLLCDEEGGVAAASYLDSQRLHALYEGFVLEYFAREHPELSVSAKRIPSGAEDAPAFLPALYTDVTLTSGARTLIIDCKCYGTILHSNMGHEILSPAHRNQIYSYVAHEAYDQPGQAVEGMLLYALTEGEAAMHESWDEAGHRFHCFTLDLGRDFVEIAAQLDSIADYVVTGMFGG